MNATCSLYDDSILTLQKVALANGKDADLRSLALDLVALLTFVGREDTDKINKTVSGLLTVAGDAGTFLNYYWRQDWEVVYI